MHWKCGPQQLPLGQKTYLMGIVNATPDSFSGDGVRDLDSAVRRALQMVADGADILDIGGESTRPGAEPVSLDEELRRVVPLIAALSAQVAVPISVDTTKSAVAVAAVQAGANIVNDISGATFDVNMLAALAPLPCGVILMHLRGTPQTMVQSSKFEVQSYQFNDVIHEVLDFWRKRVDAARSAGIADNRIALDAGFGFGKSVEENLEILRRGRELSDFGYPTLSATSRKSTIGKILNDTPVENRLFGTAAAVALAIAGGADIVRVHDVKEMAQVARVADAAMRF